MTRIAEVSPSFSLFLALYRGKATALCEHNTQPTYTTPQAVPSRPMAPAIPPPDAGAAAGDILPELDALLSATPTPTTPPSAASDADDNHYQLLRARQSAPTATVTVVSGSGDSGDSGGSSATTLSGGAIAGIVIGSIAGFLLLVWIYRSCFNIGAPPGEDREAWYHDVDPKRSPHRHHHHHSYTHSRPRHGGGHHHRHHSRRRSSLSSTMSTPPPVVVRETSRTQPVYVSRGRDRVSRSRGRQY